MLPWKDDLVQSISLYTPYPLVLHGYVFPYIFIYIGWLCSFTIYYGWAEYSELAFIVLAGIGILQILTCLACLWSIRIKCLLTCKKEKTIETADVVQVLPTPNNGSSELVTLHKTYDKSLKIESAWFIFQKTKYIWEGEERKCFKPLQFPDDLPLSHYSSSKGLENDQAVLSCRTLYGENKVDMEVPSFKELFKDRATAPFFVFQVFCVGLWCLDEYWYYSLTTLFMLVMFECTLVYQQIKNMSDIRKMGPKPYSTLAFRNNKWRTLKTNELVPGDIISVARSQHDNLVPCDLVLLRGSCVIDESMLTGESVPQMKESLETIDEDRPLDLATDSKLHILFAGTKVVQHTSPPKTLIRAPDGGCICYVLRTSFYTAQGKLLRTILYGVSRVTANNLEVFAFILFLLIFAIAAASYVWIKGSQDPERNKYKLFLECTLILTSVVPPELPIELSLAVNTSLLSLARLCVFCTEPFRIPFAGKVDVCCFDKTGTLTSDDLIVEGVTGIGGSDEVIPVASAPPHTVQVLASCHSLVQLEEGLVGDPQEKATLSAIDWMLMKGTETVVPKKGKAPGIKIYQRFHFSSQLKRMSVVAGYSPSNSSEKVYIGAVKGAPETLRSMFSKIPSNYDEMQHDLSRRGARILALGRKDLGKLSPNQLRDVNRNTVEKNLEFMGFIILSCPLKPDSKVVIKEVLEASHSVVMITGDNSLTACHVARELEFTKKPILSLEQSDGDWTWRSVDKSVTMQVQPYDKPKEMQKSFFKKFGFCLTGDGFSWLNANHGAFLLQLFPYITVFARVVPKQKEQIITTYKSLGYTTLMCGDGTNDVGALKHADCGVAILSSSPPKNKPKEVSYADVVKMFNKEKKARLDKINAMPNGDSQSQLRKSKKEEWDKFISEIEDGDFQMVKLGDASIAAPFTSKMHTIECVNHIIKQGRCTLVTTLQMFKILALNALISAYTQSVLYLDGIKFSDYQVTLSAILLAFCFLFISRSKPLKVLSKQRPLPNIFNAYTIGTVLLQFLVHFCCVIYLVQLAKIVDPATEKIDIKKDFEPNLLNSTVYIIALMLQISTFAINYRGHPYMESFKENTPLMFSMIGAAFVTFILATGISPELSYQFEIVDFPADYRQILVQVLLADVSLAYIADRTCLWVLGEGQLPSELQQ